MKGKEHDAHFKNAFQINGPYLSSIINPEDEFGEIGPTEIISNKYNNYKADYTYFTKDKENPEYNYINNWQELIEYIRGKR